VEALHAQTPLSALSCKNTKARMARTASGKGSGQLTLTASLARTARATARAATTQISD
jgi:hypothetical protein